jgi:hypothetical protein
LRVVCKYIDKWTSVGLNNLANNIEKTKNIKNNYNLYIIYSMPAKINMFITNGNIFPQQPQPQQPQAIRSKTISAPLNSGMISRIHNIKPGCGSCGRKAG